MALHVDVHGKHRGKGIKGRADGRDKGSSEHGEHQSDHSHGEKIGDHGHISLVGILQAWVKCQTDDTRKDIKCHVENLQPTGEIGSFLSLVKVFGS